MPLMGISEIPHTLLRDMATKMLVEGGADVNTEGGINRTHFFPGRPDMIQLVIDLGVLSGMKDDVIRLVVDLGAGVNGLSVTRSYEYCTELVQSLRMLDLL